MNNLHYFKNYEKKQYSYNLILYIPLDIWRIIFDILDFKSKIKLISTCKFLRQNLYIVDLYNIEKKYLEKLTTRILKYYIFRNVVSLDASDNNKINDVSFMKNLKKLNASDECGIDQNGIKELDLFELNANYNIKIKDVSFMKNLKILYANGMCGINQNGIKELDLIELHVDDNKKIKDISFMKNLKILYAGEECRINQNGIGELDLIELYVGNNKRIKNVSFMKNLKILDASGICRINQNNIDI